MARQWTAEQVLEVAWAFQPAAVLVAGAEMGVFDVLADGQMTAEGLASRLGADAAATAKLADARAGSLIALTWDALRRL